MRKLRNAILVIFAAILVGCAGTPMPTMTPMEIQSLQTREYENPKEIVFPSVLSVFQDIGYTITNADLQTGLISAESATSSDASSRFWFGVTSTNQTRATAFIEQIGSITRARVNFVEINQTSSGYGQNDRSDTPLLNATIYQNAFEMIENAIFVRASAQ